MDPSPGPRRLLCATTVHPARLADNHKLGPQCAGAGSSAMMVDVSTVLDCSAAKAWNEVQKSSVHLHVTWPLARIVSTGAPFPERWSEGLTIQCRLLVFMVIPIGIHTILIEKIDQKNHEIQSR